MMRAAHLYSLSLSLSPLIHFISIGPAEARPCWAPRCWYHPWGFLTTNLPARFNKESADDAILTVNLLGDMQTLVGKDSSSTAANDCSHKDEMRDGDLYSAEDLWEEVWKQLHTTKTVSLLWNQPADMLKQSWSGLDVHCSCLKWNLYECSSGINPISATSAFKYLREKSDLAYVRSSTAPAQPELIYLVTWNHITAKSSTATNNIFCSLIWRIRCFFFMVISYYSATEDALLLSNKNMNLNFTFRQTNVAATNITHHHFISDKKIYFFIFQKEK